MDEATLKALRDKMQADMDVFQERLKRRACIIQQCKDWVDGKDVEKPTLEDVIFVVGTL